MMAVIRQYGSTDLKALMAIVAEGFPLEAEKDAEVQVREQLDGGNVLVYDDGFIKEGNRKWAHENWDNLFLFFDGSTLIGAAHLLNGFVRSVFVRPQY